jgi:hypothetical protein
MPRTCSNSFTGTTSTLLPKRVAAVVSYYTSAREVFDQLIDLLLANGVRDREINLKLTGYLENQNITNGVPGLGCCLYDTGSGQACCNLTQEQCDDLRGTFVQGTCQ